MDEMTVAARIHQAAVEAFGSDFGQAIFTMVAIDATNDSKFVADLPDGARRGEVLPRSVRRDVLVLRRDMATPAGGAWYTAVFTVSSDGTYRAEFDYDSRPVWFTALDPDSEREMLIEDLKAHPRSPEAIPAWLSEIIAAEPGTLPRVPTRPIM